MDEPRTIGALEKQQLVHANGRAALVEQRLREALENTAFLERATKDLAQQTTPDEIMTLAAVHISEYLELSGCAFADLNKAE